MNIEQGDLFVVTQGREYTITPLGFDGWLGRDEPKPPNKTYDRSYCGCLFRAVEVCGPVVAAECLYDERSYAPKTGQSFIMTISEIEVMTVTEDFAKSLLKGRGNA